MLFFQSQQPRILTEYGLLFLISNQVKTEHSVKPCTIRNDSMSTNMAKHAFLLTWSQRISQLSAEPLPADCLLKQEMKTCTCCLSSKPLAAWAWSGCLKLHEGKSMTQSSPRSRFSLPLLILSSSPRAGVSCKWWKRARDREGENYKQQTWTLPLTVLYPEWKYLLSCLSF